MFLHFYFILGWGANYGDECVSVHSHISKTTWPNFTNLMCVLPVAVARYSSGGVIDTLWCVLLFSHNCFCVRLELDSRFI